MLKPLRVSSTAPLAFLFLTVAGSPGARAAETPVGCDVVGQWQDSNLIIVTMTTNQSGSFQAPKICPSENSPYKLVTTTLTSTAWNFNATSPGCPTLTANLTWKGSYGCNVIQGQGHNYATGKIAIQGGKQFKDRLTYFGKANRTPAHPNAANSPLLNGLHG